MEEKLDYILIGGAVTSSTTLWQVRRGVNPPGAGGSWEMRFLRSLVNAFTAPSLQLLY